jgi:hypothetical protein
VNGAGFLIAAYLGAAVLYGLYLFWLRRRERALERTIDGRGR